MGLLLPLALAPLIPDAVWAKKPKANARATAPTTQRNVANAASAKSDAKVVRKKPGRVVQADLLISQGELSSKSTKELISMIKGFQTLIKSERNPEKRAKLTLSEAGTYLALSGAYRAKDKLTAVEKKNERDANRKVVTSLGPVLAAGGLAPAQRSRAAYYMGLAHLNLNDENAAAESFRQAIDIDPQANYGQALSLFLAEQSFEKDRYQDSLDIFQRHFKKYNDSQKTLAIYKMAWCYVNLNNLDQAEKHFLMIAGKEAAGPFGYDALKDLAYVVTLHRGETDIIQFAKTNFKDDRDSQGEFLVQVYGFFQTQSSTKRKPELLAELTKIEKDPVKRLQILVSTLRGSQREYAATEPYNEFITIRDEIEKIGWKPGLARWGEMANDLEQELFHLIRAHVDTLNGKIKTAENIEPGVVTDRLVQALFFHISYYQASRERENSYMLWIKVCEEQKKHKCALEVSNRIMEDSKTGANLRKAAQMSRLRALDNLVPENASLKPQLRQSLETFIADRKPDADWALVAKRLVGLQQDEKKFDDAAALAAKIHQFEQTTESFYRQQFARFQAEQYFDVANADFKLTQDKFSEDARALAREANLKLAQKNLAGNKFEDYAKNVSEFLKSNPDAEKADVARKNLIEQLLERKMFDQASGELMNVPAARRAKAYGAQIQGLAQYHLRKGEFAKAIAMTQDYAASPQKGVLELAFASATVGLNGGAGLSIKDTKAREYIFGVWALTLPENLIKELSAQAPRNENEKKLLLLALQVDQKRLDPVVPAKLKGALRGVYDGPVAPAGASKALKDLAKITFPTAKTSKAKYETQAQTAAEKVRGLRTRVVKDLEGRAPNEQIEILKAAEKAEERTADVLEKAPLPDGLAKAQVAEYKAAIAELAGEFTKQAAEYRKIAAGVEKNAAASPASPLAFPALDRWPTPKGEATDVVADLLKKKQYAGALIALDQWKTEGLAGGAYFELRTRILFSQPANPGLARYVASELNELGQKDLFEKWKNLSLSAAKE
ncbi:MAG: hypothetical protein KF767_10875 [Bdellovibrionaceae bacterium]|nr:hypothetical protein [Pseudobdellovibrionaceae bacterium]